MQHYKHKWKLLIVLASLIGCFLVIKPVAAAENYDELFVLIGDSLMKAKEGDQASVSKNMEQFTVEWKSIKKNDGKLEKKIDQQLQDVQTLLSEDKLNQEQLIKALSALSSALIKYDQQQNPVDKEVAKEKVKQLVPLINRMKESINNGEQTDWRKQYQALLNQWTASEKAVHDESIVSYGNIERELAMIRIAITQDPPDPNKALSSLENLTLEVENFVTGKVKNRGEGNYSLTDLSALLNRADKEIAQDELKKASETLNEILSIWPMVEGKVQTRDSKLYSDIETKIPTAISILNSQNGKAEKAETIVTELNSRLSPLLSKTNYSFWDAALILLREGLEALLIVATLIAFLKKMGQASKQNWIWIGVGAGIGASALLAIVINLVFSQITAASSREYIEGFTGVIAVIMMLTVGAWLHNKSNIGNWSKYINQQMAQALAKGSLISFAVISFLSVFREGAETIIFYAGITPYISLQQLVIGVVLALVILIVVGFAIIYYSVRIPIGLFFKVATVLIYLLAFKILGISVHALQISNVLPTTTVEALPFVDLLGLYPTWETTIFQLILLAIILLTTFIIRKKECKLRTTSS
ncbi:FTR1 family iron permease [Neobacillus sp. LXY-4]|uniref:FTR1 family iron permease n=1 Tax=Neobacillus sp. LXY-4 TaxID=3379826 RepID=UPI003EDF7060